MDGQIEMPTAIPRLRMASRGNNVLEIYGMCVVEKRIAHKSMASQRLRSCSGGPRETPTIDLFLC